MVPLPLFHPADSLTHRMGFALALLTYQLDRIRE